MAKKIGGGPLPAGKQSNLVSGDLSAGTYEYDFMIDSDSVQAALYAGNVTGTVDVEFKTVTPSGDLNIITFPTINANLSEILIRKAAVSMARIRATVVVTGTASIDLVAKAITAGETSVSIQGADSLQTSGETVTTSPGALISASLTDRQGILIRNYNDSGLLFISDTLAKVTGTATPAGLPDSYIVGPKESVQFDVRAGSQIYAVGDTSIDVRIIEVGS